MQKLQGLNADNSKGELSIEKFLVKSEEAFFDRVRRDKLSSAVSYISSHRESVWSMPGTLTVNEPPSRPTCECTTCSGRESSLTLRTAPRTPSSQPFSQDEEFDNNFVVMNRIQIAMARQVWGWPLYTIVIALGQVRTSIFSFSFVISRFVLQDAGCKQLPDDFAYRSKLPERPSALCPQRCFPGFLFRLVYHVPHEAFRLRSFCTLGVLWDSILLDRHSLLIFEA